MSSTSVEAVQSPGPQPLAPGTRPGLARLTKVELRKMVDTRSGFWLLLAVAALMLLVVVVIQITGNDHDRTLRETLSGAVQTGAFLLPVVGILLITAEWGQRTALVTFSLVPNRVRVILAKVLAGVTLALVALVLAVVLAAIGVAVGASGIDDAWTLPAGLLGQDALYALVGMLMGLAFGAAVLSSAPAIVLYFGLPIAIAALGAISVLEGPAEWVSTAAFEPLTEEVLSGKQWAQAGTAAVLWIAVPLAIGLWRIRRDEVK
jgi:ABC-2 type transport system permease protein